MNRLRHSIKAIREPFGTAGLIVALMALVAALGGTAWAAAKLNGTQKKEVEKIAKKFAGKPGAPGAPGAQGPKGDTGAAGAAGNNGTNGTEGSPWTAGGTLPSGKTETGSWGFGLTEVITLVPISFALPVNGVVTSVIVRTAGEDSADCPGSFVNPAAVAGKLCLYVTSALGFSEIEVAQSQSSKAGFVFGFGPEVPGTEVVSGGSWAVTAP